MYMNNEFGSIYIDDASQQTAVAFSDQFSLYDKFSQCMFMKRTYQYFRGVPGQNCRLYKDPCRSH